MKNSIYILVIIAVYINACSQNKQPQLTDEEIRKTEEALVGANRMLIQKDREKIISYITDHKLNMKESPTGLWYQILREGVGEKVQKGSVVSLKYSVSLLDGTTCYSSDSTGLKRFTVGRGGVESGLEEGVLYLSKGAKAVFIMPPHLAHGLPGDGDKIPARSIIVYEVELTDVKPLGNE